MYYLCVNFLPPLSSKRSDGINSLHLITAALKWVWFTFQFQVLSRQMKLKEGDFSLLLILWFVLYSPNMAYPSKQQMPLPLIIAWGIVIFVFSLPVENVASAVEWNKSLKHMLTFKWFNILYASFFYCSARRISKKWARPLIQKLKMVHTRLSWHKQNTKKEILTVVRPSLQNKAVFTVKYLHVKLY